MERDATGSGRAADGGGGERRRRRAILRQTCPRCGYTAQVRSAALSLRYCPRCMARARIATPMPPVGRSPSSVA